MPTPDDAPLPSSQDEEKSETDDEEEDSTEESATTDAAPARPPPAPFKVSTFLFTFLFMMGILMIFHQPTRNQVAKLIGLALQPSIGFGGHYILLTMFVAGVLEMLLTALAYNWTTDWVKAARVQSWSAAFRKVQMTAMRSGKKDRIAALQPHQQALTKLSTEVSFAQLKGMAVTWFLVIAIYTWVGLFIASLTLAQITVNLGGASVPLTKPIWIMPLWFLLFSLYTVPFSLVFRRVLKHYSLRRHAATLPPSPGPVSGGAGDGA